MPERQSRHSDNETIDEMQDEARKDAHPSSAGGNLQRTVGSRAELNEAQGTLEGDEVERALGDDDPDADAMKGSKTFEKIRTGKQDG